MEQSNVFRRTHVTPGRRERRTIILVTGGFIAISAVLHLMLGGFFPSINSRAEPVASAAIVVIDKLQIPTPPPPAHPSPTPQPKRKLVPPIHVRTHQAIGPKGPLPPRQVAIGPSIAPGAGDLNQSAPAGLKLEETPARSAPPDDRYIIVSARFIHEMRPEYPSYALAAGEEGTVIVLLTVGPEGVSDVRIWVSSGYPLLDRAALQAAKESAYSIPEVNGEPATETYRVIYTFSLS